MGIFEVKEKITALRKLINYHNHKYYVEAEPEITDYEYDQLFKELKELEEKYPQFITPDSPTQRVSGSPIEYFTQVKHEIPMLSLDNVYSEEEFIEFDKRIRKLLPGEQIEYVGELKIDGVSISLIYENGLLKMGLTRGDGEKGDDVTNNLKTIKSIPLKLENEFALKTNKIEVRGEIYISKKNFQMLNEEREKKGEPLFANPRNAAAGSLKLLDPKEAASRKLDVFIYWINLQNEIEIKTHWEGLNLCKQLGFKVNPHSMLLKNYSELKNYLNKWEKEKEFLPYEIDGIVIKVNSLQQQKLLGTTSHHPRYAVAYKYQPEQAVTKIKNIIIQVGRTGALTPVAELEPVHLSGTIVSRATLHNEEEIIRKDIKIGDKVIIQKAGEIIPQVIRVLKEERNGTEIPFKFPSNCPICGSPVIKPEGEAVSRCTGYWCQAQIKERIRHFVSRSAMDIETIGQSLINQLVDKGIVKDYSDLYELTVDTLMQLERMGKKSAQNLINGINKSKNLNLSRLIYALGIRHIGERAASLLANRFTSIDSLSKATIEELQEINEIGPKAAESIVNFFSSKETQKILNKLKLARVKMDEEKKEVPKTAISGKTIVITGTLSLPREEIKRKIEALGGIVSSTVSKNTNYLVVGSEPGSKYNKALSLGIKIITEKELNDILENTNLKEE